MVNKTLNIIDLFNKSRDEEEISGFVSKDFLNELIVIFDSYISKKYKNLSDDDKLDIIQDILLKSLKYRVKLYDIAQKGSPSQLHAYLKRMTDSTIADYFRSVRNRKLDVENYPSDGNVDILIQDNNHTSNTFVINNQDNIDLKMDIEKLIETLPELDKKIIELYYFQGYSLIQMQELLHKEFEKNLSLGYLYHRIHKSLASLKKNISIGK